jgi:hypothetical protein
VHLESLAATLDEVFLATKVLGSHLLPEIHAAAPRSGLAGKNSASGSFQAKKALSHPAPALITGAQGGLTLDPDGGEIAADFCSLGRSGLDCYRFVCLSRSPC